MFSVAESLTLKIVIAIYFLLLLVMTIFLGRKVKTYEDYNIASRNVSMFPLILTFVGTGVGGATLLGYTENGRVLGMGQMWIHITMLFAVIVLASLFLKRIRLIGEEYNMVTIGDFTALKYGETARIPTAISFLFAYCSMTGMQFVAIASILNLTIGLNMTLGIIIGWLFLSFKTYIGGLKVVVWQDVIQGLLLTVGIFILLIGVLQQSGSYSQMIINADSMGEKAMLSVMNITPKEILIYLLTLACYQFIRQDVWQRIWAAKSLNTAKNAYWISMVIAILLGAITILIGIYSKYGLHLEVEETSLTFYYVVQSVFPFSLVIFMIVILLAAVISSADSFFIAGSSSVANDIIKPNVKTKDDKKMLKYSRFSVVIVSVISLIMALTIPGLVNLMVTGTAMSVSGLLVPVTAGLFMKRVSKEAGLYSMWVGLITAVIWQILSHPFGLHPIMIGLPVSLIVFILVSKMNKKTTPTVIN